MALVGREQAEDENGRDEHNHNAADDGFLRQVEVDGWFLLRLAGLRVVARFAGAARLRGALGFLLLREPVPPRVVLVRASALRGAVFLDELVEVVFLLAIAQMFLWHYNMEKDMRQVVW
ncbi:MAG: hypothetical protein IPH82_05570 [Chloroflexi bacterium]|nr:hypothetical protein [Chloroflexota bacterium]